MLTESQLHRELASGVSFPIGASFPPDPPLYATLSVSSD